MSNSPAWYSAYLRDPEPNAQARAANVLRAALTTAGYTLYDPFGLLPVTAYPRTIKAFVAPPQGAWVRLILDADPNAFAEIERHFTPLPLLTLALNGAAGWFSLHMGGEVVEAQTALLPYLRPGCDADDLAAALAGDLPLHDDVSPTQTPPVMVIRDPNDLGKLAELAGKVDPEQANKLFQKMTSDTAKRLGAGADADAARALLDQQAAAPDWTSVNGRVLRGIAACLGWQNWRAPDFAALREAYALHARRQRRPNATLLPGDAETMALVPNALDYMPVYAGKSEPHPNPSP